MSFSSGGKLVAAIVSARAHIMATLLQEPCDRLYSGAVDVKAGVC